MRCAGEAFFSPEVARFVFNDYVDTSGRAKSDAEELSGREREVLARIADGHSNKAVAQQLGLNVRTIETHRARIMKTGRPQRRGSDQVRHPPRAYHAHT